MLANKNQTIFARFAILSRKKSFPSNNQHFPEGLISKFPFCVKFFRNAATTTTPTHPKLSKSISFVNKHIDFL